MSVALRHSPADIVRWLLIDDGLGDNPEGDTLGAWPVYVANEPDVQDRVITVYDTTPKSDGRSMVDGEQYRHHGILVRVRARSHDEGSAKAYALEKALSEGVYLRAVTVGGAAYTVHSIDGTAVLSLGKEPQTNRRLWTINGTVTIRAH